MLVQGTGFNWTTDHFRIVFLPHEDDLREAIGRWRPSWPSTASASQRLEAIVLIASRA
jgi:hypothetical protein